MLLTTSDAIVGSKITKTLGIVKGNTIRAKHIGKDFVASLRNIVGGEITEYTEMLDESRDEAVGRMVGDQHLAYHAPDPVDLLGVSVHDHPLGSAGRAGWNFLSPDKDS